MIAAVGTLADDMGLDKVSLHVWADNEPALNLYRKSGFEIVREIPMPSDERQRHSGGMCLMVADVS